MGLVSCLKAGHTCFLSHDSDGVIILIIVTLSRRQKPKSAPSIITLSFRHYYFKMLNFYIYS